MRAVVQRVVSARVEVADEVVGAISRGLLVYLGFGRGDTAADREWMLAKIAGVRLFENEASAARGMALSVVDIHGALLIVSQFTLYGSVQRGRRPSFDAAMTPEDAHLAYDAMIREARALGLSIETGCFRADMRVHAINDGPVTLLLDSAIDGPARRRGAEERAQ